MRGQRNADWVRPGAGLIREARNSAAGTLQQATWLKPASAPAGGRPGLIVVSMVRGVVVVWRRWRDSPGESEAGMLWRRLTTWFLIGGISGWLVANESSHVFTTLAAVALALAVAVGLLG